MGDGGLGLFGKMNGGTLKNTGVNNIYIDAGTGQNAGGLIGRFDGTEMSNCFAEDVTIIGGHATYGGLIGKVWAPTISNCYVKNVSLGAGYGNSRGGFIANLTNGGATIINCYAMDLTFGEGTSDVIGLFCGKGEGGTINNCYVVQSDGKNYNFTHTTAGTTYKAGNTSVTENDLIKTKADFSGVAFAWNLNTTNNSTDNSGIWSHNGTYPIFADADHAAIYKTGYTYQQDQHQAENNTSFVAIPLHEHGYRNRENKIRQPVSCFRKGRFKGIQFASLHQLPNHGRQQVTTDSPQKEKAENQCKRQFIAIIIFHHFPVFLFRHILDVRKFRQIMEAIETAGIFS